MIAVDTSPAAEVLAYLRPGSSAARSILVVLNYGVEGSGVPLARDGPTKVRFLQHSGGPSDSRLFREVPGADIRNASSRHRV